MKNVQLLGLFALLTGACGRASAVKDADAGGVADSAADSAAPTDATGASLAAPAGQWSWIDVPESACDDGSPTGFAVNPGAGGDLFVYFQGGGACWDYASCFVVNSAVHGPFARAQWNALAPQIGVGPFDRARVANPFRASTFVFIPYCTGDLHGGNNVQAYQGPLDVRTMHHVGRKNAEAALARLLATWPAPSRVVVSGTSAGGFGATFNYDLFRRAFPAARMALVDDAGPLLEGGGIPADLRANFYSAWHLGDIVTPLCPSCADDFSGLTAALAARYPNDRLALVSALTDPVISLYFRLSLDQFAASLTSTVTKRYASTTNARAYLVTGTQHGFLPAAATTTSQGVPLDGWLDLVANGGAGWNTISP